MENGKDVAGLAKKLASVMEKIKRLERTGTMGSDGGYKFTPIDDMNDMIRPLLAAEGVALVASMVSNEASTVTTSRGNQQNVASVIIAYTLICTETGAILTSTWHGTAFDSGDKALNKATTAALKGWLKSTFLLSTGEDDPDGVAGESAQAKPKPKRAQASTNGTPQRPLAPAALIANLQKKAIKHIEQTGDSAGLPVAKEVMQRLQITFKEVREAAQLPEEFRLMFVGQVWEGIDSFSKLSDAQAVALLDWLTDAPMAAQEMKLHAAAHPSTQAILEGK